MKKTVSFLLALLIIGSMNSINASSIQYEKYAQELEKIGVFKGTSNGFELEREPTRLEGLVMLIRLLGLEEDALALPDDIIPVFSDVPTWGVKYTNFAFERGLTEGIGNGKFGANDLMIAKSYHTFLLRALGYDDSYSAGDFTWDSANEFALEINLISNEYYEDINVNIFLRDHVAGSSYFALFTPPKGEAKNEYLVKTLIQTPLIRDEIRPISYTTGQGFINRKLPTPDREALVIDGVTQRIEGDAYDLGMTSEFEFGMNSQAVAGYWDGKTDMTGDIDLFNDTIISVLNPGGGFNENGYSNELPFSFGRDTEGNPVVRIRDWRTYEGQENDNIFVLSTMNYVIELTRFYTGSDEDTLQIINYVDNGFLAYESILQYDTELIFGNTNILISDPGVWGIDIHIIQN